MQPHELIIMCYYYGSIDHLHYYCDFNQTHVYIRCQLASLEDDRTLSPCALSSSNRLVFVSVPEVQREGGNSS